MGTQDVRIGEEYCMTGRDTGRNAANGKEGCGGETMGTAGRGKTKGGGGGG